jgi:hypothetical protein
MCAINQRRLRQDVDPKEVYNTPVWVCDFVYPELEETKIDSLEPLDQTLDSKLELTKPDLTHSSSDELDRTYIQESQSLVDKITLRNSERYDDATSITVDIPETRQQQEDTKTMGYTQWVKSFAKGSLYTVYVIRTTSKVETPDSLYPFKPGTVETHRRFSEFESLYQQLQEDGKLSGYAVPSFPHKTTSLNSGTDSQVVEKRRVALQSFLRELVKRPELLRIERVRLFLLTSVKLESINQSAMLMLS